MSLDELTKKGKVGKIQIVGNLLDTQVGMRQEAIDVFYGIFYNPLRSSLAAVDLTYFRKILAANT